MIKCTVKLRNGRKIIFHAPTWLDALTRYTTEYRAKTRKVKFEEVKDHVPTDRRRDL